MKLHPTSFNGEKYARLKRTLTAQRNREKYLRKMADLRAGKPEQNWNGCGHPIKDALVYFNPISMEAYLRFTEDNPEEICFECWSKQSRPDWKGVKTKKTTLTRVACRNCGYLPPTAGISTYPCLNCGFDIPRSVSSDGILSNPPNVP